jgi:hypothetical protein
LLAKKRVGGEHKPPTLFLFSRNVLRGLVRPAIQLRDKQVRLFFEMRIGVFWQLKYWKWQLIFYRL